MKWSEDMTDPKETLINEAKAEEWAKTVQWAQVLNKIKVAHSTGLSNVVLDHDEMGALMHGLRLLIPPKEEG